MFGHAISAQLETPLVQIDAACEQAKEEFSARQKTTVSTRENVKKEENGDGVEEGGEEEKEKEEVLDPWTIMDQVDVIPQLGAK